MSSAARKAPTDPDAFIAWESRRRDRYELINGTVWAMTGGTLDHDRIAMNPAGALGIGIEVGEIHAGTAVS
ncbi:MAG TPA: hypothetical protein PKA13_01730 [Geminicoccaceae bacterium]|nr:hypothetical protein [Geminicoccus sp.]HMU48462.1 hypothetical protein [Geminicoccaceae bacterium]